MLLFHVMLLPVVLGVIVVWHVLLVRRHGVVAPYATDAEILHGGQAGDPGTPGATDAGPSAVSTAPAAEEVAS